MRVLILAVTVIGVLSGAAPASAEPGPSALAYPPPFIDHAEWTQWESAAQSAGLSDAIWARCGAPARIVDCGAR